MRDGALRAALAEEQGGIFLRWVEVWGLDHPVEHLLAAGACHPAWLTAALGQLVEDVLIFIGKLIDGCRFGRLAGRHCIEVGRMHVVVLLHEQALSVVHQLQRAEVGLLGR